MKVIRLIILAVLVAILTALVTIWYVEKRTLPEFLSELNKDLQSIKLWQKQVETQLSGIFPSIGDLPTDGQMASPIPQIYNADLVVESLTANLIKAATLTVTSQLTAPNVVYSVSGSNGIAVAGFQRVAISNTDKGSDQKIWKTFKVGSDSVSAGSNTDTFEFAAGSNIGLSLDTTNKKLTISNTQSIPTNPWSRTDDNVYLTTSTDSVGIGTSDPSYKLHVVGTAHFTGAVTGGSFTGSLNPSFTQGSVVFQGASGLAQDNANFFWDDTNDRLGMGTTTPHAKLTVNGDFAATNATISATYAGGTSLTLRGGPAGTANILNLTDNGGTSLGYIGPETGDSGLLRLQYGGGSSSYVELSSTFGSPKITLDRAATSNDNLIQFQTAGSPQWFVGNLASASNDNFFFGNPTTQIMTIEDGGVANTLYLDSAGTVGIGNAAPALALHVGSTAVTDGTALLRLQDANSTCDFTADLGAPLCGSDLTLKKDISSLSTADLLTKVANLNPVSYHWKTEDNAAPLQFGFIAQEVEAQFPELVRMGTWVDGTQRKFLNTGGLMPYVVGAVKEQQNLIAALSTNLNLQSQVDNRGDFISLTDRVIALETKVSDQNSLLTELKSTFDNLFKQATTFLADVTFKGRVFFSPDQTGRLVVPVGATEAKVTFKQVLPVEPMVNLTPRRQVNGMEIKTIAPTHFVVVFSWPLTEELIIDWLATLKASESASEPTVEFVISGSSAPEAGLTSVPVVPTPSPAVGPVPSPEIAGASAESSQSAAALTSDQ